MKDTNREKAPSNITPALTKDMNKAFGLLVHQINLFIRGYRQNSVPCDKSMLYSPLDFVLTFASGGAVLYVAFPILVLSTEK